MKNKNKLLISAPSEFLRGKTKLSEKSLEELEETFRELKSQLDEINRSSVQEKKYEYGVMSQNELTQILKSKTKHKKKQQLLLTQIGYLRINIFNEYYEQIKHAQENKELVKAFKLMKKCAELVALPFFSIKKQPSLAWRLRVRISTKRKPEPAELIQKWKTVQEAWLRKNELAHPQPNDKKRLDEFNELKMAFFALYTYSFSVDNFPPLRERRSDH